MSDLTKRRRSRELALQVLFQREFVPDVQIDASLKYFSEHLDIPQESFAYAQILLQGIEKNAQEIDRLISDKSKNWKIPRMSAVDLSLLRIGTYELIFSQDAIPPKVAIDEAIEMAKRYGGTESTNFVNGLLDEILKTKE